MQPAAPPLQQSRHSFPGRLPLHDEKRTLLDVHRGLADDPERAERLTRTGDAEQVLTLTFVSGPEVVRD